MPLYDNSPIGRDLNASGTAFLKVDLEIALTFTNIALHARPDSGKRNRNQSRARQAYDTVRDLAKRLSLTQEVSANIGAKLERLKSELEQLGETFE